MLPIYCWTWGLPFNVLCIASGTPLEKTDPSCPRLSAGEHLRWRQGLVRASHLGAGTPPGSELFPWCFQPLWLLQSLHFLSLRGYIFFSPFFNEAEGLSAKNEIGGGVGVVKPFGESERVG